MFIAIISAVPFSYAQENDFEESIQSVFEWINEVITPSITEAGMDNQTTTNYLDALDSGTDAGKKGVSLWWGIHEFMVDIVFAGTSQADLPIDKDLIVIISMFAVFVLMIGLIYHLLRENTKIALIVIVILIVLGSLGIFLEF